MWHDASPRRSIPAAGPGSPSSAWCCYLGTQTRGSSTVLSAQTAAAVLAAEQVLTALLHGATFHETAKVGAPPPPASTAVDFLGRNCVLLGQPQVMASSGRTFIQGPATGHTSIKCTAQVLKSPQSRGSPEDVETCFQLRQGATLLQGVACDLCRFGLQLPERA